jgi:hypothetical protein
MRARLFWVSVFVVAVVLAPSAAFAQQNPVAPDGTSMDEPPAAGPQAAFDACGNTPQDAFGQATPNGLPEVNNNLNAKDLTGVRPVENLSSVTGMVAHVEGDLVLLTIPMEPAHGMTPMHATPDKTMAVVRMPSGCLPSLANGDHVTVVGIPTMDGILNAETVEASE